MVPRFARAYYFALLVARGELRRVISRQKKMLWMPRPDRFRASDSNRFTFFGDRGCLPVSLGQRFSRALPCRDIGLRESRPPLREDTSLRSECRTERGSAACSTGPSLHPSGDVGVEPERLRHRRCCQAQKKSASACAPFRPADITTRRKWPRTYGIMLNVAGVW